MILEEIVIQVLALITVVFSFKIIHIKIKNRRMRKEFLKIARGEW